MALENVKSASATNILAKNPTVTNTAGKGAPSKLVVVDDYVTVPASADVDSVLSVVQIPSNAIVKSVIIESQAQGAGKFDVGLYRVDGTLLAAAAIDQDFFASVVDVASLVTPTEIVNESTTYTLDKRSLPIWQAVGLTTDPQVAFFVALTVKTTAITTGTGKTGLRVSYAEY